MVQRNFLSWTVGTFTSYTHSSLLSVLLFQLFGQKQADEKTEPLYTCLKGHSEVGCPHSDVYKADACQTIDVRYEFLVQHKDKAPFALEYSEPCTFYFSFPCASIIKPSALQTHKHTQK